MITNQANILKELNFFYESLYSDNELHNEDQCYDFIQSMSLPRINETQKTQCDTPIAEHECLLAISQLANNRSPEPDGFAVEFYKVFWEDSKRPFMECLKHSISTNQLCPSQYEGIITSLSKPEKDRFFAANYRPITLLNCDYKIISKVVNNRISPFLSSLLKNDLAGFIKGRHIGDSITLMCDISDYANFKNIPGAVLLIDLLKAFDSLNWSFMFAILRNFGFGDFFINLIRIIYKEPKCCIINNNFLSSYFEIKRRVRQGDPLSPTIFILCIEYMALLLRQSCLYKGLVIEKHCFKVCLFADDTVVYLNSNLSQFKHVFDTLNVISDQSGCKVNMNQSNAFYIGSSRKTIFK